MCGRYVVVQKWEELESAFHVHIPEFLKHDYVNYNLGPGAMAPIIIWKNDRPELVEMQFGLTPYWAKKRMYLFNARAEGDGNENDDVHYTGGKGIISKPAFKKPIRTQRCLIPANAFIEGPKEEKLSKPYLCYLKNRPLFCMAGIYDTWLNSETGELVYSFAIITASANALTQKIGHHRSPVILNSNDEFTWLTTNDLSKVTSLLHPNDGLQMNAFPISEAIKNTKNNAVEFLMPLGPKIFTEIGQHLVAEDYAWNNTKRLNRY